MTATTEFINVSKFMEHYAQYFLDSEKVNSAEMPDQHYLAMQKMDGVYGNVVCIREPESIANTVMVFSRDGKRLANVQWTERKFASVPQGIYMGEFCIENGVFEDASRFFNPNVKNQLDLKPDQYSRVYLFDYISIQDFVKGKSEITFARRHAMLESILYDELEWHDYAQVSVLAAESFYTYADALIWCDHLISAHKAEGGVIHKANAGWKRGGRTDDHIKVVAYRYFDLRVVGIQIGKGKHANVVGALLVSFRPFADLTKFPQAVPVDGKISYDERRDWYVKHCSYNYLEGKIAKVRCKGLTNKGMMRQAKLIEIRWDKHTPDM